jgi:hypothetical protein
MFNTLKAMYDTHPIRVDIAGSVESIYEITKDDVLLYRVDFHALPRHHKYLLHLHRRQQRVPYSMDEYL